ncbi:MAG: hypothetical protein Kapaf2KO_05580 [Candidatus Kapaibacteriales bacterium]
MEENRYNGLLLAAKELETFAIAIKNSRPFLEELFLLLSNLKEKVDSVENQTETESKVSESKPESFTESLINIKTDIDKNTSSSIKILSLISRAIKEKKDLTAALPLIEGTITQLDNSKISFDNKFTEIENRYQESALDSSQNIEFKGVKNLIHDTHDEVKNLLDKLLNENSYASEDSYDSNVDSYEEDIVFVNDSNIDTYDDELNETTLAGSYENIEEDADIVEPLEESSEILNSDDIQEIDVEELEESIEESQNDENDLNQGAKEEGSFGPNKFNSTKDLSLLRKQIQEELSQKSPDELKVNLNKQDENKGGLYDSDDEGSNTQENDISRSDELSEEDIDKLFGG